MLARLVAVGSILEMDRDAGNLFGGGWFIVLGWTGAAWRWGKSFYSSSLGSAMGSMRLDTRPGEELYLFRWVPSAKKWGRVA